MKQSDKQSTALRTPRNEEIQDISHACARALVCRAELHTMRQWGHLTKPSKHLGTTGIQNHK